MFDQKFYDRLISEGKPRAAEAYKRSAAGRQQVMKFDDSPATQSVEIKAEGMIKVSCYKTSCRETTLQPKGLRQRWACPECASLDAPKLYYRGNVYEVITNNAEGVSFALRNGKIITLEPSQVEWLKRP